MHAVCEGRALKMPDLTCPPVRSNLQELMTTALENLLVGEIKGVELTQGHMETCLRDTMNGMVHLHTNKIMHADLNIANLMVTQVVADAEHAEWKTKIADFSASRQLSTVDDLKDRVLGTPGYRAPESIKRELCGLAADVYAFGIVAMEILGKAPSYDIAALNNHFKLDDAALAGVIPPLLSQARPDGHGPLISLPAQLLIRSCLSPTPEDRPKFLGNLREDFSKVMDQPETRELPVGLDSAVGLIKSKLKVPATGSTGVAVNRSGTFSRHGGGSTRECRRRGHEHDVTLHVMPWPHLACSHNLHFYSLFPATIKGWHQKLSHSGTWQPRYIALGGVGSKLVYFKDQTDENTRRTPPKGTLLISDKSAAVAIEDCKYHRDQDRLQPYRRKDSKFEVMQGATKKSLQNQDKCPNRSTIFVVYSEPPFGSFKEPPFSGEGQAVQKGECPCCQPQRKKKVEKLLGQFCGYCERLVCASCIEHDKKDNAIAWCSLCKKNRRP